SKNDIITQLNIDPKNISVIPWGINRDSFYPAVKNEPFPQWLNEILGGHKKYFVSIGCSTGRKNTHLLLEAYTQLLKNNPQNHLILAWTPPDDIVAKYSHPQIHYIGKVSDSELNTLYQYASANVYPSNYEGFGLPALEAMSAGTASILCDNTSLPEVGGDACIYIKPDSSDEILRALEYFENQTDQDALALEHNFSTQLNLFSWKQCAQRTIEVYNKVLEEIT
ncbi:MAG: glycosyltransferase family 4 protein, partial [Planctomycetes bacterium]|nr:glycosyltransferase family 4 protein [Planctomycetota bacterium]